MSRLALAGGTPVVHAAEHVRWPVLGDEDRTAVLRVLERGVLSGPFAPEVRGLEREFAAFTGAKHCLATNSGTAALHIALAAAGLGPGDEVVTSAFSFVASALSVLHQGAVPVFVDIEPRTWGLDPAKLESAITPRTKAILPVHIHGTPCDFDPILAIANAHGIAVIEDACQAHGAEYGGKKAGTLGAMGAFSLQSSKNLSAGEGGLFVTDDDLLAARANRTRMFGEDVPPGDWSGYRLDRALDADRAYDSMTMGWMYRTTELSAAVGHAQLGKLAGWNEHARRNAQALSRRLVELPGVSPPEVPSGRVSVFHKYRVRLDASKAGLTGVAPRLVRDAVLAALKAEGVEAVLWQTQPVPGQRLFKDRARAPWDRAAPVDYSLEQFPETQRLLDSSLCLFSQTCPIYPQPEALVAAYAEAFAKVWGQLDEVLAIAGAKGSAAPATS